MKSCKQDRNSRRQNQQQKLDADEPIVVRLGDINIFHYDHPSPETIRQRTEEVMRDEITGGAFFDDCPLCQDMKKHPHDWVYYQQDE